MKELGLTDTVEYKGGQHTVMAMENRGSGKVFVVLKNKGGKEIRLRHTDIEKLIRKGDICLNSASKPKTARSKTSTSSARKKPTK